MSDVNYIRREDIRIWRGKKKLRAGQCTHKSHPGAPPETNLSVISSFLVQKNLKVCFKKTYILVLNVFKINILFGYLSSVLRLIQHFNGWKPFLELSSQQTFLMLKKHWSLLKLY